MLAGMLVASTATAAFLVSLALRDNLSWFRTPTEVVDGGYPEKSSGRSFRLGGLVETGSVTKDAGSISFRVTDLKNSVVVRYSGVVPSLFRDGQGVVAEGRMDGETFAAQRLMAKHDEKYAPPEVKRALGSENAELKQERERKAE